MASVVSGLKVVAEGVEDQAIAEQLATIGCDHAQGHAYSVPVSAHILLRVILGCTGAVVA